MTLIEQLTFKDCLRIYEYLTGHVESREVAMRSRLDVGVNMTTCKAHKLGKCQE
jgi:hypothetical protein